MEKDMKTVRDYENKRKLEIFKGQCFNASIILYGKTSFNLNEDSLRFIFENAEILYEEGLKRGWLNLKEDA